MNVTSAFVVAAALGSVRGAVAGGSPAWTADYSAALLRFDLTALRPYGEAIGGAFIALAGIAFWLWPAL